MKGSKKVVLLLLSIFIVIPMMASFISCSENSITEPTKQDDEFLKKAIIGNWSNSGQRITYYENGTYVDSSSYVLDATKNWVTDEITKGSYKIVDGILYYSDVHYTYMMDRVSALIGEGYPAAEIRISNNTLSFTGVDIYTPNGKTDGISGHWETKKWATSYNSQPEYSGYLNCAYDLDKSTSTYFRQIRFLDNPTIASIEDRDLFEYESPNLKMVSAGQSVINYTVEIKNGKMYWYYDNKKPYDLYKE